MSHPEWGKAELVCDRNHPIPSREMFEYTFMPEADKEAAVSARSMMLVRMVPMHEHVLRDRKLMLRFLWMVPEIRSGTYVSWNSVP